MNNSPCLFSLIYNLPFPFQESYETRRKEDAEARKAEEEKRAAEEKKRKEDEERMGKEMQKEEERQSKLKKPEDKPPVWQDWPVLSYVFNVKYTHYRPEIFHDV